MRAKFSLKAAIEEFTLEAEDGTEIEDMATFAFMKEDEKIYFVVKQSTTEETLVFTDICLQLLWLWILHCEMATNHDEQTK